jgi:phosphonate transport system permease protein
MNRISNSFELHKRNVLTLLLILVFILSLFSVSWGPELLHPGGRVTIVQVIESLFKPDLSTDVIKVALISTWRTLAYAVAGMTLATVMALVFGVFASGVLSTSKFGRYGLKPFFRGLLGFMRAIHELIWAWLFVAAVGLTPYAAIFALAIPYGGILGRIYSDILNDVPKEPIKALKSSGASRLQILFYGYFSIARADMISYTMYRLECAVRSSTIMSFVGLGGLGFQIQLALQDLNYHKVWTYMFFLIALVILIDLWSNLVRRELVE